jgi:hypothetical protein
MLAFPDLPFAMAGSGGEIEAIKGAAVSTFMTLIIAVLRTTLSSQFDNSVLRSANQTWLIPRACLSHTNRLIAVASSENAPDSVVICPLPGLGAFLLSTEHPTGPFFGLELQPQS